MSDGPEALQIRELKDTISELNQTIKNLQEVIAAGQQREKVLQEQIDYLTKKLFGRSSEKKLGIAEGQLSLFDEAETEADPNAPDPEIETTVKEHIRKQKTRLSEKICGIPVQEIVEDVPEEERICPDCGTEMQYIGREYVRSELKYIPAKVTVLKYYSKHYACPKCRDEGNTIIVKSDVGPALLSHSLASPSSVAWAIYQKYANGLPLYRQEKDWKQYGIELSRTTLANWIMECGNRYFKPLYDYFRRKLLEREFLMADETRVQVLKEPGKSAGTDSYMWLFRSGEDGLPPIILYDYSPTRAGAKPAEFLKGFHGYLMCDGYAGYNKVPDIVRCACYAHIRRYFADAVSAAKSLDLSDPAVQGIQYCDKLFRCEQEAKEKKLRFEERRELRLKKEKPVIDAFVEWLKKQNPTEGSRFDKAVKYTLNQLPYMYSYLEDGRCSLSNNLSENAIRPFTVGRKNWLFSASVNGAKASAMAYTMVEMAKAHSLNIFLYLQYILACRPSEQFSDEEFESLAPWNEEVRLQCSNSANTQ